MICYIGKEMMQYYTWDRPPYLLDNYKTEVKYTKFAVCRPKNVKALPLVYRNTVIYSADLLRYATELGDSDAPFWLGLMYDHGLSDKTPKDAKKANEYYRISAERGCRYVDVWQYVAKNGAYPQGFTDNKEEALANVLFTMINGSTDLMHDIEIGKIFDDGKIPTDIFEVALILLCFYAEKGCLWSTCSLANAMFMINDFENERRRLNKQLQDDVRSGSCTEADAKTVEECWLDKNYLSHRLSIACSFMVKALDDTIQQFASRLVSTYKAALRGHNRYAEALSEYYDYR